MDLEKQNLADELALTRAELEKVRSQSITTAQLLEREKLNQLPDREKLNQECDQLLAVSEKLGSENQELLKKLQDTRAELKEVRSQKTDAPVFELPEPAELLNQFRKKLPKSKIGLRDVEMLLELL